MCPICRHPLPHDDPKFGCKVMEPVQYGDNEPSMEICCCEYRAEAAS